MLKEIEYRELKKEWRCASCGAAIPRFERHAVLAVEEQYHPDHFHMGCAPRRARSPAKAATDVLRHYRGRITARQLADLMGLADTTPLANIEAHIESLLGPSLESGEVRRIGDKYYATKPRALAQPRVNRQSLAWRDGTD
jgi:hypothetical protein